MEILLSVAVFLILLFSGLFVRVRRTPAVFAEYRKNPRRKKRRYARYIYQMGHVFVLRVLGFPFVFIPGQLFIGDIFFERVIFLPAGLTRMYIDEIFLMLHSKEKDGKIILEVTGHEPSVFICGSTEKLKPESNFSNCSRYSIEVKGYEVLVRVVGNYKDIDDEKVFTVSYQTLQS